MTKRQTEFWLSVKPILDDIVADADDELRSKPVGHCCFVRLPHVFTPQNICVLPYPILDRLLFVMKTPEGLMASEHRLRRKGMMPPKPRLIAARKWAA